MSNGLRLFGAMEVFLEARVGSEAKPQFLKEYGCKTGMTACDENAFMVRAKNGWSGAVDLRIYFSAPDWVVESLQKIGCRVVERQIDMEKYEGGLREYKWKVCNKELFWWLVEYGYRIGKNAAIPFGLHEVRQALKEMPTKQFAIIPMIHVEAENPIVEAKMFAEMAR